MKEIHVGDTYRINTPQGFRVWKLVGDFLGAEHQEDMLGLMPLDRIRGHAYGAPQDIMLVPRALFLAANPERC